MKKIHILFASFIGAIFISILVFYIYDNTEYLKSTKDIYLKTEENALKNLNNDLDVKFFNFPSELSMPFELKSEFTNVEIDGITSIPKNLLALANSIKLNFDLRADENNNKSDSSIKISLKDHELATLNIFQDKNKFDFYAPSLYAKHLLINEENIKPFVEKNISAEFAQNIPQNGLGINSLLNSLLGDKETPKVPLGEYIKLFANSLTSNDIIIKNNIQFKAGNENILCRKISIILSEKDFKTLIIKLLKQASEDKSLYAKTYGYLSNFSKIREFSNLNLKGINPNKLTFANYVDLLSIISNSFESTSFPDGASMTLWVYKDQIVGRSLNIVPKNTINMINNVVLDYNSSINTNKNSLIKYLFTFDSELLGNYKISVEDKKTENSDNSSKGLFTFDLNKSNTTIPLSSVNATVDYSKSPINDKNGYLYKLKTIINSKSLNKKEINLSLNFDINTWNKDKFEQKGSDTDFKLQLTSPQNIKISGKLSNEFTKISNIRTSVVSALSSEDLNNFSKSDTDALIKKIGTNAVLSIYFKNQDLIKMFF